MFGSAFKDQALSASEANWRALMLIIVALLGAIVLGGLVQTLGEANRQRDRALALQTHSFQVMSVARAAAATVARAEASLGRYVISGDRQLGVRYGEQWRQAGDQLAQLARITSRDARAQRDRIDRLRASYAARTKELELIALSTRYRKNDQAISFYYKARDSASLSEINDGIDQTIDAERTLLATRTSAALQSVSRSTEIARVLVGFGFMLVLGAIALGWLTVSALAQRGAARAEADAERERTFELERAVAEATAELKQQAIERAATEEKLRQAQKMDAVGQLTGGIAHDFNNMLAVVLGGLELARRNLTNIAAVTRHIDNATEGANRAVALTRRLLAFSRAETLLPTAIEVTALIEGMTDLLDRTLGDSITVRTADDGQGWSIWADRHQLENALLNLAVNARDAMDGRGTLTIATGGRSLARGEIGDCMAGDYATIAVTDTGAGIPPEILERVFEPFFTTKPVGQGTGLGLSQIFGFVRQSSGEIAIDSTLGVGTIVTLYLPRHRGDALVRPAEQAASASHNRPFAPLSVLVVEDDPRVLATTIAAVEALGHGAIGCGDPHRVATLLSVHQDVDLIISDVRMPQETGPEMIARISLDHPDLAVLFVTGFTGEESDADDFGGHGVLRKPFSLSALEQAIARAIADRADPISSNLAAE